MSQNPPVFYRPADAWVGDVIPWVEDDVFHLFYLHEVRRDPKPGTPWHVLRTDDPVRFADDSTALVAGGEDDADFNAYTGSIAVDPEGRHHLFYTGQNPRRLGEDGLPLQLVMHATSDDGMSTWQRHPEEAFGATPGYETADWRDPFVFWDEDARIWRMLITARHTSGPDRRRGVIAQCVSHDLTSWAAAEPFWDPRRYVAQECPEVFHWGGWWYLVFSEFSESFTTRYRMSRSLHGPWLVPEHDTLDGRAYYAAKSAGRDGRRFFFGWIASKEGDADDGAWQWAGSLSVLEARQNDDGTLATRIPQELRDGFSSVRAMTFAGSSAVGSVVDGTTGYSAVISDDILPSTSMTTVTLDVAEGTRECGILLRASEDGDESYAIRLEPSRQRMVFDRWPRKRTGDAQWEFSGDVPFAVELERPCTLRPGAHTLEVLVEDDICVVTLDGAVTLSTRIYDRPQGRIGVFAGEGAVTIRAIDVAARPEAPSPAPR